MSGGVYLAYPIDQQSPTNLGSLFDQIETFKTMLISSGVASWVFDPGDAFRVDGVPTEEVARINRHAHAMADMVVAFLPKGVPTVGVPMEIDRGMSQGKHVIVFTNTDSYMLQYGRRTPVQFRKWDDEGLIAACDYLDGLPPIDHGRDQFETRKYLPFTVERPELLPRRTYEDDAGMDLIVSDAVTILPGTFMDIPCGTRVQLEQHTWGMVTGRSSALRKRGLLVHTGIIDSGYRGELYAGAWNMTKEPVTIEAYERVAQFIILSNLTRHYIPVEVEQLNSSPRGDRGFGSSGR